MQICLSMSDLFLPPGLKRLRRFPACYEFLDNCIEIWIKFGFEEKQRILHAQVYFQRGCISVLQIALFVFFFKKDNHMVHFRLYLKQYCAWQICQIACRSVIEALNISSEL